jgi:hypothetical protein
MSSVKNLQDSYALNRKNTLHPQQDSPKEASNDDNYRSLYLKLVLYKSTKRRFANHL